MMKFYSILSGVTFLFGCVGAHQVADNDPSSYFNGVNNQEYLEWLETYQIESRYSFSTFVASQEPSKGVAIHWSIVDSELHLAVAARSKGWVGFGIAEAGGVLGSDMAIFAKSRPNEILDTYVLDEYHPQKDDCEQDWVLVDSSVEQEFNDFLMFETRRKLDTGDAQDKKLMPDADPNVTPTRVVATWGDEDDYEYHKTEIARGAVRFYSTSVEPVEEAFEEAMNGKAEGSFFIGANDFTIPTQETTYADFCFTKSDLLRMGVPDLEGGLNVIGIRPVISDGPSHGLVHHFIVNGLYDSSDDACSKFQADYMVYGWAPGTEPFALDDFLGIPVFGSDMQGFKIQIHYNNPLLMSDVVDSSGVELYYTSAPREMKMGVLMLADPFVALGGQPVGPGFSEHVFDCSSSCSEFFLDEPVTVIKEAFHMHHTGTRMTNHHIRNGKVIRDATVEVWEFDQNGLEPVQEKEFEIQPGDSFRSTCYYDSSKAVEPGEVTFGLSSANEMCIVFMYYYPLKTYSPPSGDYHLPWMCRPDYYIEGGICESAYSHKASMDVKGINRIFGEASCRNDEYMTKWRSSMGLNYAHIW